MSSIDLRWPGSSRSRQSSFRGCSRPRRPAAQGPSPPDKPRSAYLAGLAVEKRIGRNNYNTKCFIYDTVVLVEVFGGDQIVLAHRDLYLRTDNPPETLSLDRLKYNVIPDGPDAYQLMSRVARRKENDKMENNVVETSRVKIYRDDESVLPFDVFGVDTVPRTRVVDKFTGNVGVGIGRTREEADRRAYEDLRSKNEAGYSSCS